MTSCSSRYLFSGNYRGFFSYTRPDGSDEVLTLIQTKAGKPMAFICDILINAEFRRKGYATQVLKELEQKMQASGILDLNLHVFGHNQGARKLYEKLGFSSTSIQMKKSLAMNSFNLTVSPDA